MRAIENSQYVNAFTNTDPGYRCGCRLSIDSKVRDFFLNHICRSLYTVYLYVSNLDPVTEPMSWPVYY